MLQFDTVQGDKVIFAEKSIEILVILKDDANTGYVCIGTDEWEVLLDSMQTVTITDICESAKNSRVFIGNDGKMGSK